MPMPTNADVATILQAFHRLSRPTLPRFGTNYGQGEYALLCPSCGGECLHHDRIDVYEPLKEDADAGQHVTVEQHDTHVSADLTGNPSRRRNGVTIRFWCETCQARPVLRLAQHKGTTYVSMIHEAAQAD